MSQMADSPVRRQMDAYRESWKVEHDAVQECWIAEDTIRIGIATLEVLRGAERSWRRRVLLGNEPDVREASDFFYGMYARWLDITKSVLEKAALLEHEYQADRGQSDGRRLVDGASALREAESRVEADVTAWKLPHPSVSVGMREIILSPDAAIALDAILERSNGVPPPIPAGPVPRKATMAEFLELESNR